MFDLAAARQAGYSDAEIIPYLAKAYPAFDVAAAAKAGYSLDEIASHLGSSSVMPYDVRNEAGLQAEMVPGADAMGRGIKEVGDMTKAGGAGIGDLIAHPNATGLDRAVTDINHVENDQPAENTAGKVGSFVGGMVTPEQIAIQHGLGAIGEAIGPWVTNALKGWAGDAAMSAVGKIKTIAKELGVANMDELGKFLLSPITIGGKTFDPIVTATASAEDMLARAQEIRKAAGAQLEAVSGAADQTVKDAVDSEASNLAEAPPKLVLNLGGLPEKITALKEAAVGDLPKLGKDVAMKFENAADDLSAFAVKQANGPTATAFSDLGKLKTKLGNLAKFGSQTESNLALQQVYHAVDDTLSEAAANVSKETGAAYAQANEVYHKILSIVEGLEGKTVDARNPFGGAAMGALSAMTGALAAVATHNPVYAALSALAPVVGGVAGKVMGNYVPQMAASVANTALPAAARGVGYLGQLGTNAIADALRSKSEDQ